MDWTYPVLKAMHVLSATLLFGTGLGTAFHMWLAHLGGDAPLHGIGLPVLRQENRAVRVWRISGGTREGPHLG